MKSKRAVPKSIDDYISGHPPEVQTILEKVRRTLHEAAPEASETISYQIPAFKLNVVLVYFGAWKNHIGFYPTASGIRHFQKELSSYKSSRGAVQFPFDQPMPYALISRIVKFRVTESIEKK